jgi:chemotaxis signal transduction protein
MMFSDYKKPTHIKGGIEFEGHVIPVIDPSTWLCGEPTRLDNCTCILVVQYTFEYREFKTGILIQDSEEIMNLAAGAYSHGALEGTTFNMRFVLEIPKSAFANKFLADSHLALNLCQEKKRMDDDFATFRKILSTATILT